MRRARPQWWRDGSLRPAQLDGYVPILGGLEAVEGNDFGVEAACAAAVRCWDSSADSS